MCQDNEQGKKSTISMYDFYFKNIGKPGCVNKNKDTYVWSSY